MPDGNIARELAGASTCTITAWQDGVSQAKPPERSSLFEVTETVAQESEMTQSGISAAARAELLKVTLDDTRPMREVFSSEMQAVRTTLAA